MLTVLPVLTNLGPLSRYEQTDHLVHYLHYLHYLPWLRVSLQVSLKLDMSGSIKCSTHDQRTTA